MTCSHRHLIYTQALLLYDPPSRINAQQALLHPYFASLDKKSLPAVGEEYVGLPISRIPPDIAGLFNALINIDESDLEGKDEEWMEEAEEIVGEMVISVSYFFTVRFVQLWDIVFLLAC